ncbi:predicted protein [Plenodomus lingam JN3]|uniref:Predicted protein n=1 Tax=Leptosphaeria maculans (strain JN3 / isolate v23.1.3 / race Av1-4-5-6-7-8) TaxID=985895 RepID=E4ZID9_LEPMJ|nr:predicted protein [Plenodomus lingam JN3]CBX90960.1 predicted protein [Plenodomus lingam JN3]
MIAILFCRQEVTKWGSAEKERPLHGPPLGAFHVSPRSGWEGAARLRLEQQGDLAANQRPSTTSTTSDRPTAHSSLPLQQIQPQAFLPLGHVLPYQSPLLSYITAIVHRYEACRGHGQEGPLLSVVRNSGLVLASGYLSTAPALDYSFALDKPLHTVGVVLLLTGLVIVATEVWLSRTAQPRPPTRFVAIALSEGQRRPPGEEIWTETGQPGRRKVWTVRAVGALLTVLMFAICGRIAVFYCVMKHVECAGPSTLPFLPLILALYHSLRHPSQRQYPAWSLDSRPRTHLDRVYNFVLDGSTRYIIPSILLSISGFLVNIKTDALRSTYICPIIDSTAAGVPSLQFIAFLLDCIIVQILYRFVDDGISPPDDWTIHLQDGTSNHFLVGLTFIASSLIWHCYIPRHA